ncbi:10362_t:CDS:2 [Acaulospora colombiana]|uniref:10362_t:CDS:1 n=1 Tax=Acaulospora colombiana TaxID=27376 RepID=A0ACA9LZX9_9GLOM|nr:10362_t:CDS:2 [Acaulospora colombiana]
MRKKLSDNTRVNNVDVKAKYDEARVLREIFGNAWKNRKRKHSEIGIFAQYESLNFSKPQLSSLGKI